MDDQELITAIENVRKGIDVEENFNFIYYRSHLYVENRIRFYVHGRKTASYDIEDITQDVYIYMSTHLTALKEPKAFWAWTDKIAAGKTNDFFDSRQGKTIAGENALEIQTDEDDDRKQTIAHDIVDSKISNNPEQRAMQAATVAAVHEILDDLTDAQKEVIIPFFLYNKKEREIAEELNLNLNTVKSRLKSGKDAIYKRKADLRKRGVEIAVIPFVLLLHIAYRSDEALAATLTAGMAASGMAKAALSHETSAGAKASAEAAASASKAAAGTGEAAKTVGSAAGGAKTAGAAGMSKAAAVGSAGAAKAAGTVGTGIAVKAAAAVAAAAVIGGGAGVVYKSVSTPSSSVATSSEAAAASLSAEAETTAAEESSAVNSYVDVYGNALQEFATKHNFSLEELNIGLFDFDQDGELELAVSAGYNYEDYANHNDSFHEALYRAADDSAELITEFERFAVYSQTNNGVYFSYEDRTDNDWPDYYYLLHDGKCEHVATVSMGDNEVLGEKTDRDTAWSYIQEKLPDMEKTISQTELLTYDDFVNLSDDELMYLMDGGARPDDGTSVSSMKEYFDQFEHIKVGDYYDYCFGDELIQEIQAVGPVRDMGNYYSISNATICHLTDNEYGDPVSASLFDGLELRINKDAVVKTYNYTSDEEITTTAEKFYQTHWQKFVPYPSFRPECTAVLFSDEVDDRGAITSLSIHDFG